MHFFVLLMLLRTSWRGTLSSPHKLFGGGSIGQGQPPNQKIKIFCTQPKIVAARPPDFEKIIVLHS